MSSSEDGQQKPSIYRGVILTLTPSPKGVIKGQPPNIDMFGIKSKVLTSISSVINGQPTNIVLFGILMSTLTIDV